MCWCLFCLFFSNEKERAPRPCHGALLPPFVLLFRMNAHLPQRRGTFAHKNVLLRHPAVLVGSCLSYTSPLHQFGKVQLPLALPVTAPLLMWSSGACFELFLGNVSMGHCTSAQGGQHPWPRPSFSCIIKMKTKDSPGYAMGRCCCLLVLRPHAQFHLGCLL